MSAITERLSAALAGRYEVERELGSGGMATVYLVEDLKHKRKVALKVLKPELAAVLGAERFVQEITTTAALQHPHILPLFDSGTADGFLYYVMPWIQGEALREKLNRETQLGVDEAVQIAREVADALEYAHQHGVVHRDIKPENILLHGGHAMVVDFGIALAVSAAAGGRMTETGLSLGTPHYMSPEQATAEKVITARSDVYSLGSVLYEMLSGQPPHLGGSAQQIIMKIIAEPVVPVTALRKSVPPNVSAAVAKSLEKLPADRFESAKAFADALVNPAYTNASGASAVRLAASQGGPWRRRFYGAVAVSALLLVAFAVAARRGWWSSASTVDAPPMHVRLALAPGDRIAVTNLDLTLNAGRPTRTEFAFSPNGQSLVLALERNGTRQLFLRPLVGEAATPIAGTEGGESPFFSPDGKQLGFWANGHLRRLTLAGGPPADIATVGRIIGASWGENDRIVVGTPLRGLLVFPVGGAANLDSLAETGAVLPQFLPGAKAIVFTKGLGIEPSDQQIEILSLTDGTRRILIPDAADARFVSTGHLVFARRGTLMAVPINLSRLEVTGSPVVVLDDLMQSLNATNGAARTGAAQVAISAAGQLAWLTGGITPDRSRQLFWLDRRGAATKAEVDDGAFQSVRIAPDGKRLAIATVGSKPLVIVVDLARRTSQVLATAGTPGYPLWTPDGNRVARRGKVGDSEALVWSPADGSRPAEPIVKEPLIAGLPAFWSADGSELIAWREGRLSAIALASGARREISNLSVGVSHPALSPDGHWLAYGGADGVYVQPWPALDKKWKVSTAGGTSPAWTKQGRELVYQGPPGVGRAGVTGDRMMAVEIGPGPNFSPGIPRELFTGGFSASNPFRNWDVTADGSRFLVVRGNDVPAPPGEFHVMTNWFTELRRLVAKPGARP